VIDAWPQPRRVRGIRMCQPWEGPMIVAIQVAIRELLDALGG
jgi:hypothetical protein